MRNLYIQKNIEIMIFISLDTWVLNAMKTDYFILINKNCWLFILNINKSWNIILFKFQKKNEKIKYSLHSKTENIIIEVIIKNNSETQLRRFIYFFTEIYSQHLSKLYPLGGNKRIHIEAALEIDHDNKIISHHDNESLYCVFPLIGPKTSISIHFKLSRIWNIYRHKWYFLERFTTKFVKKKLLH